MSRTFARFVFQQHYLQSKVIDDAGSQWNLWTEDVAQNPQLSWADVTSRAQ